MKKYLVIFTCLLVLSGCGERRRVSRETHSMTTVFESKMKKGETTRDQEQRFITEMKNVTYVLDSSIRGTKAANKTKQEAEAIANNINPDKPMELNK